MYDNFELCGEGASGSVYSATGKSISTDIACQQIMKNSDVSSIVERACRDKKDGACDAAQRRRAAQRSLDYAQGRRSSYQLHF